ncbi:protein shisa-9-like [Argiope bruennichi]|uniref:protein shisa-9-like n=1 Tax=Argiope bruennichi TaxID=94029 RepID=UPI0024942E5E|nr:protein shisa-9-like [Argiope bruennichi]XP_055936962.1 protein shisa-9-like [Argiope bruennichi]
MSLRETDVKELASQDHEVLGSDFCSGYTDIFGKWNTGFDCPRMGNGETVYCCGTVTYKYCCTRRDQHSGSSISQSVLLGSALGSVLMIILVTLVSCLICRRCVPYRRAHPSLNGGPLYTMHCSSTASGMANMYSFSGQPSSVTTPLDAPHVLVDLDNPEHAYTIPMNTQRGLARHLTPGGVCETPSDPPPPYNEANNGASGESIVNGNSPSSNSFDLRTSRVGLASQQRYPINPNRRLNGNDGTPTQNTLYWSTKF